MNIRSDRIVLGEPDFHGVRIDIGSDFVEETDQVSILIGVEDLMTGTHRCDGQLRMKMAGLRDRISITFLQPTRQMIDPGKIFNLSHSVNR